MLNVELPINQTSFGNVAFSLLKEMEKAELPICLFPYGGQIHNSTFDWNESFDSYVKKSVQNCSEKYSRDNPALVLWHLAGSEKSSSKRRTLFTFHEVGSPTEYEKNICANYDNVIMSSSYSVQKFKEAGVNNCHFVPLGFSKEFFKKVEQPTKSRQINFSLIGKWEKRKHTAKIIYLWLKRFGGDNRFKLNCLVNNGFMDKAVFSEEIRKVVRLYGKDVNNVEFFPHISRNASMNDFYNHNDIDISGLSGAEGWGLPSFNMCALGKQTVVLNATSHKDWATKDNSILIEPTSELECYDDLFFKKGARVNQGVIFDFDGDAAIKAMEEAASRVAANVSNFEGEKLAFDFTYKKTLKQILQICQ